MDIDLYNKISFNQLKDIFPSALYIIKNSKIVDCNRAAVEIFGYQEKNEIIGLKPYDLSPEKQSNGDVSSIKGEEIIARALHEEQDMEFVWTHKKKNGDAFFARIILKNYNNTLYAVIIDIDEVQKLKKELKQRQENYQLLFENHKSMMLLVNPSTGKIIDANKSAVDYYGYSKNQLLSMRVHDINALDEEEVSRELSLAKLEKRNYFQFTHRIASNQLKDVEVHSFPVEIGNEKLLFSIIHDVSDKTHQKLMFDTLFFDSPYAVAILDKNQNIINVNRNFTNLFQYCLEDVKGKAINDFVSTKTIKAQVDKDIQLVYRGEVVRKEDKRRKKDGTLIDVEILSYPIINHNIIIGAYIIYSDISKRKSTEKQLHLYRKILESLPDGVIITELDGKIKWINKAFMKSSGYSFIQVIEKKPNLFSSGLHDKEFYENMWREIKEKGSWQGTIYNKNKRGSVIQQVLNINGIEDENNRIIYYVGIYKA
ncbi:PAS domain S-box protein [Alkaliphilus pronyensis]|uniref:PAS domain S-box protein n=1 Tax=Alkaliphilus pronyensis TaxID=1482732 RepID=A0A6I0FCU4_9FIRM|nr:PAS domain-containing protein [Alkaliphilus pronyensis]KAB3535765.1 PAS domain S-box protein [Alkaliphilus pronyensis]